MRRLICLLTAMLLCMALVGPAYATEDAFVPSIAYKPNPEIIPVTGEDGQEHFGVVKDEAGSVVGYIDDGCLEVTPIAYVWDEDQEVPADVERLLVFVYDGLNSEEMELPYEKLGADVDAANMVIRDLFDARWRCTEHPEMLAPDGVVMELTFDLGIFPDVQIFAMTYDEETKEWSPIVNVVNNGDGTVTCTFEHLCAIAFSMTVAPVASAVEEVAVPSNVLLWIIVLAVAAIAAVALIVLKNKKIAVNK